MSRNRSPAPVSRFPVEMMNALVQGARGEIRIPLPTRSDATQLRQKLYMLRAAMKREQHYSYRIVERAEVKLIPQDPRRHGAQDPFVLVIQPANLEYVDALRAAGIDGGTSEEPPIPSLPATLPPAREIQETDYMEILRRSREEEEEEGKGE